MNRRSEDSVDSSGNSGPLAPPPEAWKPIARLVRHAFRPLERFFQIEAASGIVLLAAAAIALVWANSPWAGSYRALWHARIGVRLGAFAFENSLEWFVNDVVMAIFFFVVGMEIRQEIHDGELSSARRATLPVIAAIGGMLVPAALYLCLASGGTTSSGWGVPMATDIAFAIGVLVLLGNRVPPALRMLLLALAVIDDLGAILVIAFFYSSGIALSGIAVAGAGIAIILVLRAAGARSFLAYVVPGVVIWAGVYYAGVHPTIAGVIVGLLTPVEAWLGGEGFIEATRVQLRRITELRASSTPRQDILAPLAEVGFARREAVSPSQFLVAALHPWVAYLIMPLFALANAGVELRGSSLHGPSARVTLAVTLALVVGKPLGVIGSTALAIKSGFSERPQGLTVRHLVILGIVAGIGFTMSLFVAQLAFKDPALLGGAKLGVLLASAFAMILGLAIGRAVLPKANPETAREPQPAPALGTILAHDTDA